MEMGFEAAQCREALERANGDQTVALNYLLQWAAKTTKPDWTRDEDSIKEERRAGSSVLLHRKGVKTSCAAYTRAG